MISVKVPPALREAYARTIRRYVSTLNDEAAYWRLRFRAAEAKLEERGDR